MKDDEIIVDEETVEAAPEADESIDQLIAEAQQEVNAELQDENLDPELESILDVLEGMSPAEIQAFGQQNPALMMKLQKYARKMLPPVNYLENRKKTGPAQSLADFKSKKKKKGGKKAAKSKKK